MSSDTVVILRPPGQILRGEDPEDELDLGGVRRPRFRARRRVHRQWQSLVELVPKDRRSAGLQLQLDPFPGGIRNEVVAGEVLGGPPGLGLRRRRIEFEKSLRVGAEPGLARADIISDGRLVVAEEGLIISFIPVPSGQKRDMALLAGGVDGKTVRRQEISIDVRPETFPRLLQRRLEQHLARAWPAAPRAKWC